MNAVTEVGRCKTDAVAAPGGSRPTKGRTAVTQSQAGASPGHGHMGFPGCWRFWTEVGRLAGQGYHGEQWSYTRQAPGHTAPPGGREPARHTAKARPALCTTLAPVRRLTPASCGLAHLTAAHLCLQHQLSALRLQHANTATPGAPGS